MVEIKKNPELADHILNAKYLPSEGNKVTLEDKKRNKKRTLQVHKKIVNLGNAAGVNTKNVTTSQIFDKINNLDKARTGLFSKDKGMTALDFDDTVAKTKSKVIVITPQNLEWLSNFDKITAHLNGEWRNTSDGGGVELVWDGGLEGAWPVSYTAQIPDMIAGGKPLRVYLTWDQLDEYITGLNLLDKETEEQVLGPWD